MESEGPFERYTLIYCQTAEGIGVAKRAAFSSDDEAVEFARLRLLRHPPEWNSVVIARGIDADGASLDFIGSWDRNAEGAVSWDAASLT